MRKLILALSFFKIVSMFFITTTIAQTSVNAGAPLLQELIESAIHKDYELKNKQLDVALTEVDLKKVNDSFLPRVNIVAQDAFSYMSVGLTSKELSIPLLNIDIKEGHNRFNTSSNTLTAGANLTMLLYSGKKVSHSKKALENKSEAQKLIMETDRQQIMSKVIATYDQLALLKQVKRVLDEASIRLDENKKTADKALSYGLTTKYEHQKIEVARAQLASRIVEYQGKRKLILKQLNLLTNIVEARLLQIDNNLETITVDHIGGSIKNRAELRSLDAALRAGEYKVRAEKTWIIPKVSMLGNIGYMGAFNRHISSSRPFYPDGPKLSSDAPSISVFPTLMIGVAAKWDIFDGHTGKYEVRKAVLELQQTQNNKSDMNEKLELNLAKCKTDYMIAIAQIVTKAAQQQTAENALKQATKEFRNGLIKSLQLIDAENDLEQAALDYINGIYTQRRAAIDLLMATGDLNIAAIIH